MNSPHGPVLVAYDGSAASRQALSEAAGLMGTRRALVVTVWEAGLAYASAPAPFDGLSSPPPVDPMLARDVDRGVHEHAESIAREGCEIAKSMGLDAQPLAVSDESDIAHTLVHLARAHDAAAIVIGSRGLSGLRARLEGSTSKSVLKHAQCPVLVVHEHGEGSG